MTSRIPGERDAIVEVVALVSAAGGHGGVVGRWRDRAGQSEDTAEQPAMPRAPQRATADEQRPGCRLV